MQALKLSSSQVRTVASVLCFAVSVATAISLVGCGSNPIAMSNADSQFENYLQPEQASPVLDAGIVFVHELSYLCVPLTQLEIADGEDVQSVTTSCECTSASIVQFVNAKNLAVHALRVDFNPDRESSDPQLAAVHLGVLITLKFKGGRESTCTVKFLRTAKLKAE